MTDIITPAAGTAPEGSAPRANTVYDARIEGGEGSVLRQAGEWIAAAAEMALGGPGTSVREADVVVRRRSDEGEVLRLTPGTLEDAEAACDDVERSLASMTAAEFEAAYLEG